MPNSVVPDIDTVPINAAINANIFKQNAKITF